MSSSSKPKRAPFPLTSAPGSIGYSSYAALQKSFSGNSYINGNRRSTSGNSLLQSFASKADNLAFIERELVRDLLFIFQGINGKFVRQNKDNCYEILTETTAPVRELTLKLCELGHCYNKIKSFKETPSAGSIIQGFKYGLDIELHDFYRLLAEMKAQIQDSTFDSPLSEETKPREEMTLIKLGIWITDIRFRLEILSCLVEACSSEGPEPCHQKHGGELCSIVFLYTEHGDPVVKSLAVSLLTALTKPLYLMLGQWILYGELEDPYNEFFIAADKDCKMEDLWHSKFHIREKMLPSFMSMKQAKIILATGKNINFLRDICNNSSGYEGRDAIKTMMEETPVECLFLDNEKSLGNAIQKAYRTTSDMVLKVLIHDSRLIHHLNALKKYLLLGQGDFIQYLLELLQHELAKPVPKLYQHNLSAILESAIRATNAQFEDEDILKRLDTRILYGNEKETGWDVFCLDYKADGPIGTAIVKYNQLFNTLWRTKRIEKILSNLWKNQTILFKYQRSMLPELGPVLHQVQLLIQELIHFVHQTQYYIMFEATECAWDSLMRDVNKATDLDQVIKAHESFLSTIISRSLLDIGKRDLLNQLRAIFGTVHKLSDFLTAFDDRVTVEVLTRRDLKNRNVTPLPITQKNFFAEYIAQAKGEVEQLYTVTQDLVYRFLIVLNGQQDSDSMTLQCLSFRLDFSEYYAQRDARLSFPLTYLSRRLSTTSVQSPLYQSIHTSMNLSHSAVESSGFSPVTSFLCNQPIQEN